MKVVHKELYIGSYRIVSFNRDYNSEDKCDDSEDEQDIDNSKLTCLYNITRYRSHEDAAITGTVVLCSNYLASLYNTTKNMFRKGAINGIFKLRSISHSHRNQ